MPQDRTLSNLQRKLDRWELNHLRALVTQQADRIERLEDEVDIAQQSADYWHEQAMQMVRDLSDAGETVGITQDEQIGVVEQDNLMTERRGAPIEAVVSNDYY